MFFYLQIILFTSNGKYSELINTEDLNIDAIQCLRGKIKGKLCYGIAHEIDEKLLYAIQNLNIKGYKTVYCCQGHYDGDLAYILF